MSEQNLSFLLRKSKNKITTEAKSIDKEKLKNVVKENTEKKPIDIFANLKAIENKSVY